MVTLPPHPLVPHNLLPLARNSDPWTQDAKQGGDGPKAQHAEVDMKMDLKGRQQIRGRLIVALL